MFYSYRNQSVDLHCKSVDFFLYEWNISWKCVISKSDDNWSSNSGFLAFYLLSLEKYLFNVSNDEFLSKKLTNKLIQQIQVREFCSS